MDKKFSVIIPTMWKCKTFVENLDKLSNHQLVDEIIIINNSIENTPILISNNKIVLIDLPSNIMVNPAWNLGFYIAKNNYLCFMNDDNYFNLEVLDFILDKLNENVGMVGVDFDSVNSKLDLSPIYNFQLGFACLFFVHKKSYYKIPKNINVYFGDHWIFEMNKRNGKQNYKILGSGLFGGICLTSCDFVHMRDLDKVHYDKALGEL